MVATVVILSPKHQLILQEGAGYHVFSEETFNELDFPCKVVWDARGSTQKQLIKDKIESCCLLVSIDILDWEHGLESWLPDISVFHLVGHRPVVYPDMSIWTTDYLLKDVVVSNVCWPKALDQEMWYWLLSSGISRLNLALSMYGRISVHEVRDLKSKLDAAGMTVFSLNAIFYGRTENLFADYYAYIQHFRKMLQFAKILGAKCVVYGSPSSKHVITSWANEYENYAKAHITFVKTMTELATIADTYDIDIYIKPNKNKSGCNYLFEQEHVDGMVNAIDHPRIKKGSMRESTITSFDTFHLVEVPADLVASGHKLYISNLLGLL
jgi:hypothetical protein